MPARAESPGRDFSRLLLAAAGPLDSVLATVQWDGQTIPAIRGEWIGKVSDGVTISQDAIASALVGSGGGHGTLEALQIALASLQILPQICCLEEDAYVFVTGKKLLLKVADESISPFLARWQWFETACIQDGHEKYIKAFFVDYHKFVKEFNAKLTNKSVDSFFTLSRHLEKLLVIG